MAIVADALLGVDTPTNIISLRADLNGESFDRGAFVIVPYGDESVMFVTQGKAADLASDYHGRAVTLPDRVARLYLYIRFVWNIFHGQAPLLGVLKGVGLVPCPPLLDKAPKGKGGGKGAGGGGESRESGGDVPMDMYVDPKQGPLGGAGDDRDGGSDSAKNSIGANQGRHENALNSEGFSDKSDEGGESGDESGDDSPNASFGVPIMPPLDLANTKERVRYLEERDEEFKRQGLCDFQLHGSFS